MEKSEKESLLAELKRIERKLDIVIRAIYEHDEDIQDEYGRSQRSIDARRRSEEKDQGGDVLGECNESSPPRGESGAPVSKRRSEGEANSIRDNGKVPRQESISRSNGKSKNVSRKDGIQQHATSKPILPYRGDRGGKGKGGFNGST
jgi:hypothetical protein